MSKNYQFNLRLGEEDFRRLDALSERFCASRSSVIRMLLKMTDGKDLTFKDMESQASVRLPRRARRARHE